jgi:hypothetical protein
MATRLATSARNASANAAVDLIDAGAGPGTVEIRTGAQPATPNTAASGTLLATATLNDPAFGDAVDGVNTLDVDPEVEATGVADGTAGWFRARDSAGNAVFDGAVTATGGGGQLELNTTTISVGVTVTITALTYTQPLG